MEKSLSEKREWRDKQLNACISLKKTDDPPVLTQQINSERQVSLILYLLVSLFLHFITFFIHSCPSFSLRYSVVLRLLVHISEQHYIFCFIKSNGQFMLLRWQLSFLLQRCSTLLPASIRIFLIVDMHIYIVNRNSLEHSFKIDPYSAG